MSCKKDCTKHHDHGTIFDTSLRVLIVEPNADTRKLYGAAFNDAERVFVDHLADAVKLDEEEFDLIIAEPGNSSTFITMGMLRLTFPKAQIVIATHHRDLFVIPIGIGAIEKPFRINELFDILRPSPMVEH